MSLGSYGGTSDGNIPVGQLGRLLVLKMGTDDLILLGERVYLTVRKIEGSLMRVIFGVLFGLSMG